MCRDEGPALAPAAGNTESLITAPGATCQLEILRPGLACFEANSSSKKKKKNQLDHDFTQCGGEGERGLQKKQSQARASAKPINNGVCEELE